MEISQALKSDQYYLFCFSVCCRPKGIVVDGRIKKSVLSDLLSVHASSSNSIVFTKTKREADALSSALANVIQTEALHGDISQGQREATLRNFREGKFNVLVATDVAARGLDIPNVDLVVHYDMPDVSSCLLYRHCCASSSQAYLLMFLTSHLSAYQLNHSNIK